MKTKTIAILFTILLWGNLELHAFLEKEDFSLGFKRWNTNFKANVRILEEDGNKFLHFETDGDTWVLVGCPIGKITKGILKFRYRGTTSPQIGKGYGTVGFMFSGKEQGPNCEIGPRFWEILVDATTDQWKEMILHFESKNPAATDSVLRFSLCDEERKDILKGESFLDIDDITIEAEPSDSTAEK